MTTLKITKISSKPFTGQYGKTNRVGLLTEEYKEEWLNGFMDEVDIKEGDIIYAEVERKGSYLNFKFKGKVGENLSRIEPTYEPEPQSDSEPPSSTGHQPPDFLQPEKTQIDEKAFGMCKYGFLIECFKANLKSEDGGKLKDSEAEYLAEKWAEMSIRMLKDIDKIPTEGKEINPPY